MRLKYFLLLLFPILSSCARLMNDSITRIEVVTNVPASVIVGNDTVGRHAKTTRVRAFRSNPEIVINVFDDSVSKTLQVKPANSTAYPANAERYTYPRTLYVDMRDTANTYRLYQSWGRKNQLNLNLSLPHINHFAFTPQGEPAKNKFGFMGICVGAEYYYSRYQYWGVYGAGVMDFLLPFPAPVDYFGPHEKLSSLFGYVTNNRDIRRFSFGYGLSFAHNTWKYMDRTYNDTGMVAPTVIVRKTNTGLGPVLTGYYRKGKAFCVGVIYRPTILIFSPSAVLGYEHVISIDFAWKLKIRAQQ